MKWPATSASGSPCGGAAAWPATPGEDAGVLLGGVAGLLVLRERLAACPASCGAGAGGAAVPVPREDLPLE
eukprot:12323323-Alexandrium_andersonii.AAC.1